MYDHRITVEIAIRCDRCGVPSNLYRQLSHEALAASIGQGFKVHRWKDGECHRELVLCAECDAKEPRK